MTEPEQTSDKNEVAPEYSQIAAEHYLSVREEDFAKALDGWSQVGQGVGQQLHQTTGNEPQAVTGDAADAPGIVTFPVDCTPEQYPREGSNL